MGRVPGWGALTDWRGEVIEQKEEPPHELYAEGTYGVPVVGTGSIPGQRRSTRGTRERSGAPAAERRCIQPRRSSQMYHRLKCPFFYLQRGTSQPFTRAEGEARGKA